MRELCDAVVAIWKLSPSVGAQGLTTLANKKTRPHTRDGTSFRYPRYHPDFLPHWRTDTHFAVTALTVRPYLAKFRPEAQGRVRVGHCAGLSPFPALYGRYRPLLLPFTASVYCENASIASKVESRKVAGIRIAISKIWVRICRNGRLILVPTFQQQSTVASQHRFRLTIYEGQLRWPTSSCRARQGP